MCNHLNRVFFPEPSLQHDTKKYHVEVTLHLKSAIPNSQRYTLKRNLINNMEDIVVVVG